MLMPFNAGRPSLPCNACEGGAYFCGSVTPYMGVLYPLIYDWGQMRLGLSVIQIIWDPLPAPIWFTSSNQIWHGNVWRRGIFLGKSPKPSSYEAPVLPPKFLGPYLHPYGMTHCNRILHDQTRWEENLWQGSPCPWPKKKLWHECWSRFV